MEHDYLISLLVIVGIDLILGGDNAVVIAMASRNCRTSKDSKPLFSEHLSPLP